MLKVILENLDVKFLEPLEFISRKNDPVDEIYFINSGNIEVGTMNQFKTGIAFKMGNLE
jgi:signal-transduction protein with cAMP-binding, CBS, and nucleotidyltransferase domain